MKKCFLFALVLFLLLTCVAKATEMSTSVPSNSQYTPTRIYGFQIDCNDIANVLSATLEWNSLNSYVASESSGIFYYNLTSLAAGDYSYRWLVNNTSDILIFTNTYTVMKNSSANMTLTLDGTNGDKNYKRYTKANFIANLNVPNKQISLDSNYPGWITRTGTSFINNTTNLTNIGLFSITASWNGDENYTSSSATHYFDSGPPRFSNEGTIPNSHSGYMPGADYKFQVNCIDTTLTDVWFETNFSGTMTSYNAGSDPPVQNSSGLFWITFKNLGAKRFFYRWHAKDSLDDENVFNFTEYVVSRMQPLIMDILPSSSIREGTQVTATCYSINPLQVNISNFVFFKNSEAIKNITSSTRMDLFLMSVGSHNFTCTTNGTENYTNQTITRIINVSSNIQPDQDLGELKINDVNFPSIKVGENGLASFRLVNSMSKNIFNISVNITGIPLSWFNISKPSYIYAGETKEVRVNLTIPYNAEAKTYNMYINVRGNTSDKKTASVIKDVSILVTSESQIQNQPPAYISGYNNKTGNETMFLLEWEDDNGLSGYIFSYNITGDWTNDSWIPTTGLNGLFNITKDISSSSSAVIAWKIYSNDTNNDWSVSEEYLFEDIAVPLNGDSTIFIIIVIVIVVFLVLAFIIVRKKSGSKKEEYVYSQEDLNEKTS